MYEVWEKIENSNEYYQIALFHTEENAQDYVEYLLTINRKAKVIYSKESTDYRDLIFDK